MFGSWSKSLKKTFQFDFESQLPVLCLGSVQFLTLLQLLLLLNAAAKGFIDSIQAATMSQKSSLASGSFSEHVQTLPELQASVDQRF